MEEKRKKINSSSSKTLHCSMQTWWCETGRQFYQGVCRLTAFPPTSAQMLLGQQKCYLVCGDRITLAWKTLVKGVGFIQHPAQGVLILLKGTMAFQRENSCNGKNRVRQKNEREKRAHAPTVLPIMVQKFRLNVSAKLRDVLLLHFLRFPWFELLLLAAVQQEKGMLMVWVEALLFRTAIWWVSLGKAGPQDWGELVFCNPAFTCAAWVPSGTLAGQKNLCQRPARTGIEAGHLKMAFQ